MFYEKMFQTKANYLSILALALSSTALGQELPTDILQGYVDDVAASEVPGVVLLVSGHGEDWASAAGFSSIENQTKLGLNDSFPVFSVTKTLTAVTILQLIEEGRLSFDDTLGEVLLSKRTNESIDNIPNVAQITIRQLLNHSSGIVDFGNTIEYLRATLGTGTDYSKEWSTEELLSYAHVGRNEPKGAPGGAFSYSSTGYLLLGIVIEEIEQQSLPSVFDRRIFTPLGISDTYLPTYDNWHPADTTGYVMMSDEVREMNLAGDFPVAQGELVNATKGQRSRQGRGDGDDGAVSTARSLMIFANALFAGDLLSNAMLMEMLTPQNLTAELTTRVPNNYGLGLHLRVDGDKTWALMIGNGAGGEAMVGRELESGLTFVVLTNVFGAGVVYAMRNQIMSMAKGGSDEHTLSQ
jgi:D-alanyl-D-alanine carboxypeptidase